MSSSLTPTLRPILRTLPIVPEAEYEDRSISVGGQETGSTARQDAHSTSNGRPVRMSTRALGLCAPPFWR